MRQTPLGAEIRKLRFGFKFSLRQFARDVGISPSHLSHIELGRRYPSERLLIVIAFELQVPPTHLTSRDPRVPLELLRDRCARDPSFAVALRRLAGCPASGIWILRKLGLQ